MTDAFPPHRWLSQYEAAQRGALLMLILYEKPRDFPDSYVVRQVFTLTATGKQLWGGTKLFKDAASAMRWVTEHHPDMVPMDRDPSDEPPVLGSWI